MRVTIKDVAKKAGLSITTVSLVLNGKPSRIPEETKEIVRRTADELGYIPSQAAVELKTKRSNTIGIIVTDVRNVFFSSLVVGVERRCRENGWNVILCNSNNNSEREAEYVKILVSKGVDGIVLGMSTHITPGQALEEVRYLEKCGVPYVLLDKSVQSEYNNNVTVDHVMGGYIATKHLLELGHRQIACVTGADFLEGSKSRLEGYKKALKEYDVLYDPELVVLGNYEYEGGFDAVETLSGKPYTAVFAFNDMMTFGVVRALKQKGYRVPEDISVVGYDDSFVSEIYDVPLTMVAQPYKELGITAADMIIDIADKKKEQPLFREYEPRLVVRGSAVQLKKEK